MSAPVPIMVPLVLSDYDHARKTEEEIFEALEITGKLTDLNDRNYTGLKAVGRYFTGDLGESVFKRWLERGGVRHVRRHRTDGKPDGGDFEVKIDAAPRLIDVKTTDHIRAAYLMDPLPQFERHKTIEIFVAISINHEQSEARIMGWVTRKIFGSITPRKIKDNGPMTLAMPFTALRDMRVLYRMMEWLPGSKGRGHDRMPRDHV